VAQQEPIDLGRLAAPIDKRLEIPIQIRPAELPPLDRVELLNRSLAITSRRSVPSRSRLAGLT
jgi:hypothetical protein